VLPAARDADVQRYRDSAFDHYAANSATVTTGQAHLSL